MAVPEHPELQPYVQDCRWLRQPNAAFTYSLVAPGHELVGHAFWVVEELLVAQCLLSARLSHVRLETRLTDNAQVLVNTLPQPGATAQFAYVRSDHQWRLLASGSSQPHPLHHLCTSDVPRRHAVQPERLYLRTPVPPLDGPVCPVPTQRLDL